MKKIRLLFLTLVALIAGAASSSAKTVYIQPNAWANDNAVISLWVWADDSDGSWATLTSPEDGIYKAELGESINRMIITRGSEGDTWTKAEGDTQGYWNQTGTIEIADENVGKLFALSTTTVVDGTTDVTISEYSEPVAAGYTCDFNTSISTSDHAFQVASNWRHIVDSYESSYSSSVYYPSYSYSETAGVDGTGALSCSTNQNSNSIYDLLVTPVVKGTVTIDAKTTASYWTPQLSFYKITDNGDGTYTRGDQITVDVSAINSSDYTTITIPVDEAGERIGIRSSYVWLDNFTATEATIIPEAKLTITSAVPTATTGTIYWEQQANGKVLVSYTVTVTNTGEVDLTQGDEGFSVSIINGSTGDVYATVAVPQNLAIGETSDEFVVSTEVETSLWPNSYTYINMNLKENLFGSVVERAQSQYTAYESKFVFREAGSTSTSSLSSAQSWGTITESTSKNFEIANTGTAPMTITAYTAPEGFTLTPGFNPLNLPEGVTLSGTSVVMQSGAVLPFTVTQDASATGTYSGTLTITYQAYGAESTTDYTLDFTATVIGENTWTADFNGSTSSGVTYPAGAVAEAGITTDYQYISSGNYNIWLTGRSTSGYDTANNKFITPKLHANAGDQLAFDVKAGYNSSDAYFVKVYVSTDRVNWGEPVETYVYSTVGSSFTTKTLSFDTTGDYYVAFALYGSGSGIDNLVGLEKVDVAHDLYIKEVSWPDASVKSGTALTKPSVSIIPLTTETADAYTVKYICGETVLAEGTPVALTASTSSTTSIAINWTPVVESTTVYEDTKVVFEFTDGTKFETETFDLTVTNEAIFHFLNSIPSSKWYEPTDRSDAITFGKTNTDDTQSFVIFNWGSADLTVNSISLPEGFTTTTEFPLTVAAFNGENDGLSASSQALDITFSAATAGTFSGDMVITYSGDKTFTLAISGTKLDPNKWYANFNDQAWPAGSVYQDNVSVSYISTGDYGLLSSSSTKNIFITPKLTAAAGDVLQFDASTRNSSYNGTVKVYVTTDRENLGDAVKEIELSKTDNVSKSTYDYTFTTAGDFYVAFALEEARVDEIYGLTLTEVEHDWQIASSNIPAEAMQNYTSTATVNILNLGIVDEAAENITVTAYIDGVAAATADGVAIPMNHKLSDAGTQLSVSYMSNVAGTLPVYLEVKAGDYSVTTDPVDVVFAEEEAKSEADMAANGTAGDSPLNLNYKNSESVTMYNAEALAATGLSAGSKIKKITYKGYKTTDEQTTSFQVYYKWTDDQTLSQPDNDVYPFAAADNGMTQLIDEDHTWNKVGSSSELGEMIVLDFSDSPLTYESGKSLVIYMHSYVDGYKVAYFEKSTLSTDYCYERQKDDATISGSYYSWTKKTPAALHFELDASAATLAGTVTTSAGTGIEGATVTLKAENGVTYSGMTDADGTYSFNVIQAGLDFTATVEKEGFLNKEFAYSLGGESKTLNVILYTQMGIVGDAGMGLDWDNDLVMTQSTEDPNIFTLTVKKDVTLESQPEAGWGYKLRADGAWLGDDVKYELPNSDNNHWKFNLAGTYTFKFTANVSEHTLTLEPSFKLEDNAASIAAANLGGVTITSDRQFKAGWNAIYLPVYVSAEEVTAIFGEGAEIAYYAGDEKDASGNVTAKFDKRGEGSIEAGVPYLLWCESAVNGFELTGREISDDQWPTNGTAFNFVGTYSDVTAAAGDYFIAGGKFVKATSDNTILPFRSYLKLNEGQSARSLNFVVDDQTTTQMIEGLVIDDQKAVEGVYNLQGQKVQNISRKGLYIINGKKVMVK